MGSVVHLVLLGESPVYSFNSSALNCFYGSKALTMHSYYIFKKNKIISFIESNARKGDAVFITVILIYL